MADELKNQFFNRKVYQHIASELHDLHPPLDQAAFVRDATRGLAKRELNDRMRWTAELFHKYLPEDFTTAVAILKQLAPRVTGYSGICIPEFIGRYGTQDPARFDESMSALHDVTEYSSAEFAVRLFLQKDFARALKYMERWSRSKNFHVRRLSSEGLRPRLPWSGQLKNLIADPAPALPILATLRADPELYVRKSVANHLNDIAKDHPERMLDLIETWDASNAHTAWIQKQACRTLIKAGHPRALKLFGFGKKARLKVATVELSRKQLSIGEDVSFSVRLESAARSKQSLIVDYRVDYCKKDGSVSGKVFKLTTTELAPGATLQLNKKHSFVERTTRKHYPGKHGLTVLVNGSPVAEATFILRR